MPRGAVVLFIVCAGCRFSVDAIEDVGGASDLGDGDLAAGDPAVGAPGDLSIADLAAIGDLAVAPPDLIADPCANPPAPAAGDVAAQCVIGNPPTIDGNLADWPLGQFISMTRTSAAQAAGSWGTAVPDDANVSARYFVKWDLTYLYIAVSVTDDVRQTPNHASGSPNLSDNDAVELFVDGKHDRTTSYGSDDWQLVYSADAQKEAAQGNLVGWPAGTHEAWGGATPAWTLEAAIPWTLLGGAPATLGRVVGFDLKLDDNDGANGDQRDRDLVMYYDAGNGGGSCAAPYCRTDAFSAVQLLGR